MVHLCLHSIASRARMRVAAAMFKDASGIPDVGLKASPACDGGPAMIMHDRPDARHLTRRALLGAAALVALAGSAPAPAHAQAMVDLQLVLAVDASGSVN